MQTTLDFAIYYTEVKNFSVIPLNGKIPDASVLPKEINEKGELKATWRPFQTRKPTRSEIDKWFGNGSKRNIGIATGSISGIGVVDMDSQEAVKLAKDLELPVTPLVKTGRGYHAYYRYRDGVRNFQKRDDLPGIDLRGDGGYVVAPPSIHTSGVQYAWVEGKSLDDIPMAEFPEILLARHGNNSHKTPIAELYRGATEGSRNDRLARLIGSLVRDGLSQEDCLEFAYTWNTRNNPPLPEGEVEQTVRSIFNRHHRNAGVTFEFENRPPRVKDVEDVTDDLTKNIPIPEFPMEVFPTKFQQYVASASTSIGIDAGAYATMCMAALSSCTGNTLQASPNKQGFEISPFLWTAIVLPSGASKSPAMSLCTKPVKKIQQKAYAEYKQAMLVYEGELDAHRKDKQSITPPPIKPSLVQYYVSDSTIESLSDVFESQPRGVLNYQDELSGFILGFDQYKSKGGNGRQHILDLFNCGSWKVDRKSGSRCIPNTGMAIIGGIQPMVLPKVLNEHSFVDGLCQRFLFLYPDAVPQKFSRHSIPDSEQEYWERMVNWCLEIPLEMHEETGMVKSMVTTLSPEALEKWIKFHDEYAELRMVLPERLSGFIPKLHIYSLKLAGVLHVMRGYTDNRHISLTIDLATIGGAIKLTEYYFGQVRKLMRLFCEGEKPNECHNRIVQVLHNLQGSVANGALALSLIVEEYNTGLPEYAKLTPEKISRILNNELGLTTRRGTHGYRKLLWDEAKMKNLLKTTVTTVTTVTGKSENNIAAVTEVTDVTDVSNATLSHEPDEGEEVEVEYIGENVSSSLSKGNFSRRHIEI